MSSIPLTKGQFTLVNDQDYDWLIAVGHWCFSNSGYATHYFTDEPGQRKTLFMHRAIMERMLGHAIPRGLQVDHISGSVEGAAARLNNRRENLRLATRSQNQANKGVAANRVAHYKGATWSHGKWEARIKYRDQRLYLGRFVDERLAAMMHDAASRRLYQDFAGCNFPDTATPPTLAEQLQRYLIRYGLA